jgi:transposase InsO family protein
LNKKCKPGKALKKHGIIQSMSRKGNCWDNAVADDRQNFEAQRLLFETTMLPGLILKKTDFQKIK